MTLMYKTFGIPGTREEYISELERREIQEVSIKTEQPERFNDPENYRSYNGRGSSPIEYPFGCYVFTTIAYAKDMRPFKISKHKSVYTDDSRLRRIGSSQVHILALADAIKFSEDLLKHNITSTINHLTVDMMKRRLELQIDMSLEYARRWGLESLLEEENIGELISY